MTSISTSNGSSKVEDLCKHLGTFDDMKSSYKISANCLQVLLDIETELLHDCRSNRKAHLNLGKAHAIENHFIQILIASGSSIGHSFGKPDEQIPEGQEYKGPIIQVVVRILVNLTLPLECLSDLWLDSDADSFSRPSLEFNKLQTYLLESKKAFLKYNSGTAAVVKLLRVFASMSPPTSPGIIDLNKQNPGPEHDGQTGDKCSQQDVSGLEKTDLVMTNNCLVLLRNLLHVPDADEFYKFEPFRNDPVKNNKEEELSYSGRQMKSGFLLPKKQYDKNTRESHFNTSPNKGYKSMSSGSSSIGSDSDGYSARTSIHTCVNNKKEKLNEEKGPKSKFSNQGYGTNWYSSDPREEWQDVYKKLMWNLLAQGLDGTILFLLSSKQYRSLTPSIAQLITLLFKDQPVNQLQKILIAERTFESSDEDLESDESSSVHVSSSSSFFSDSSLLSSSQSGEGETHQGKEGLNSKNQDKKSYHLISEGDQNYMNPSDSGISSSSNISSDQSTASNESLKSEKVSDESKSNSAIRIERNPGEQSDQIELKGQEDVPEASDPENSCCLEAVKQSRATQGPHTVERRAEQTSGISNGSSEEDQNRVLRRVMKPHHRSQVGNCKTNESDSSEEYNVKPSNGETASNHEGQMNATLYISSGNRKNRIPVGFFPSKMKTKCSPSICFNAAVLAATNSGHQDFNDLVVAPWNRKKVVSSKNFPLGVDSYIPTNEDIASLLKDFVVKFLHNSFDQLVVDLKDQLLTFSNSFDPSHLFWLISYFTKLALAIDLNYHHLESILKTEIFAFLVYEGIILNEQLELNIIYGQVKRVTSNRSLLRKIHLIISSLHELFNLILSFSSKSKSNQSDEMESLRELRSDLAEMTDLPQLFLLCIRSFIPTVHSKQFLIEAIVTHHTAMILLEPLYLEGRFDLPLHLTQFATVKIMDTFGKVLQDFKINSDFVNDCILTMMHHVAGDLMLPDCLFQPIILKTFSLIMESDVFVKDCWGDMIEYIMIRFVRVAKKSPAACIRKMFGPSSISVSSSTLSSKTVTHSKRESIDSFLSSKLETALTFSPIRSDKDRLYWLYLQFEQAADPISMIVDSLVEDYDVPVGKIEVLDQLLFKGIIDSNKFKNLKGRSNIGEQNVPSIKVIDTDGCDKVQSLIKDLSRREMKLQVSWIQDCISKFGAVKLAFPQSDAIVPLKCHAIPFYSHSKLKIMFNHTDTNYLHSSP